MDELGRKEKIENLEFIVEYSHGLEEKIIEFSRHLNYSNEALDSVAAIIMVKDEERSIKRCINSISKYFDEIIIVDTGSQDSTIDMINIFAKDNKKIKLFFQKWNNDFSAIRNYALKKVSSDWLFFIDADEYFGIEDMKGANKIKNILTVMSKVPDIEEIAMCPLIEDVNGDKALGVKRIFRSDSSVQYYGKIHEEPRMNKKPMEFVCLDIKLYHDGYKKEIYDQKNKAVRNYNLTCEMLKDEPGNIRWVYFFIRDNLESLAVNDIEKLIKENLLIKKGDGISVRNLKDSEFLFAILDLYARSKMNNFDYKGIEVVFECLEHLWPQNSNSIYYRAIIEIIKAKQAMQSKLEEILRYRKNHFEVQYGTLHSEGAHIDFVLGILLFENGHIKNSIKYFDMCKDRFTIKEIEDRYRQIVGKIHEEV